MKKIFSLFVAALMSVSMWADTTQQDISLDGENWGWGYNSSVDASGGKLNVTIYSDWGAVSTGWDPEIDLSSWDKIVVVVDRMDGCEGQWFKLKAYLRDKSESEEKQLEGTLGLDAADNEQHEIVINLKQEKEGFDITKCRILAIQSEPTGATFTISRVYMEKEAAPEPAAKPETAPAAPTHDEENVMALYGNHYAENNLHFNVLGWGDVKTWETLKLGEDSTNVLYCQDMKWEMMTNWDKDSYDFSEFEKFHFDVWVPGARHLKVTFEAQSGWKHGIDFKLNEGWNTIDADPVWWNTDSVTYEWKDVKYIAFEGYKYVDSEVLDSCTSAEGTPFAFANLYWWKSPAVVYPDAPALPTIAEEGVMALFCPAYTTNTVNFEPQSWGGEKWENPDGKFFYTAAMTWDAFTNWGTDHYDMYEYDTFVCDIYVTVASNIKITFEALGAGDGGTGWKNGAVVEGLKANEWNHVEVDLLNAPFDTYEFRDVRYLILEGFTNEGTPLGIANAMFVNSAYLSVENVNTDVTTTKRIENGRLIIERNGVKYNAQGAVEK